MPTLVDAARRYPQRLPRQVGIVAVLLLVVAVVRPALPAPARRSRLRRAPHVDLIRCPRCNVWGLARRFDMSRQACAECIAHLCRPTRPALAKRPGAWVRVTAVALVVAGILAGLFVAGYVMATRQPVLGALVVGGVVLVGVAGLAVKAVGRCR